MPIQYSGGRGGVVSPGLVSHSWEGEEDGGDLPNLGYFLYWPSTFLSRLATSSCSLATRAAGGEGRGGVGGRSGAYGRVY